MASKLRYIALIAGLLGAAGIPTATVAGPCFIKDRAPVKQDPDAPVQINGYFATLTRDALDIEFVDKTEKPITEVVWEVRVGNGAAFIRDQGTFAPGVAIRHCNMAYGLHGGNYIWRQQAGVRVVRVRFADGTQWATSDAPPDEPDF